MKTNVSILCSAFFLLIFSEVGRYFHFGVINFDKLFNWTVFIAVVLAVAVLTILFKSMAEVDKAEEKGKKEKSFYAPFYTRFWGRHPPFFFLILFLIMPVCVSAAPIQHRTSFLEYVANILSVVVIILVIITISGLLHFSQKRFSHMWPDWDPMHKKTWLPFLRTLSLFNLLEPFFLRKNWSMVFKKLGSGVVGIFMAFVQIAASISSASAWMMLKEEPKEVAIVRKYKESNK